MPVVRPLNLLPLRAILGVPQARCARAGLRKPSARAHSPFNSLQSAPFVKSGRGRLGDVPT